MSPRGQIKAWESNIDQGKFYGNRAFKPANADKLQLWHKIVAEIYYWLNGALGWGEGEKLSALWR